MADAPYPDVEDALLALLEPCVPGPDHIDTATDEDLRKLLPFIRVNRFAGSDDGVTDVARVTVDVFARDRSTAQPVYAAARALINDAAGRGFATPSGFVTLDEGRTDSAPTEVPYGGESVRLWTATYRITLRRSVGA